MTGLGLAPGSSCWLQHTQPPSDHVTQDAEQVERWLQTRSLSFPHLSHLLFSFTTAAPQNYEWDMIIILPLSPRLHDLLSQVF